MHDQSCAPGLIGYAPADNHQAGTCAAYCCDDGDCGSGQCVKIFNDWPAVGRLNPLVPAR